LEEGDSRNADATTAMYRGRHL